MQGSRINLGGFTGVALPFEAMRPSLLADAARYGGAGVPGSDALFYWLPALRRSNPDEHHAPLSPLPRDSSSRVWLGWRRCCWLVAAPTSRQPGSDDRTDGSAGGGSARLRGAGQCPPI